MTARRVSISAIRVMVVSGVFLLGLGRPQVVHAACGDGTVEAGEQCDDGNTASGDCCSDTCAFEANGTACDDGNPCTTGGACAAGECVPSSGDPNCNIDLDHFKCYQAGPTPGAPRFARQNLHLVDEFETVNSVATRPRAVCNPVSKNDEGIDDQTAHLTCYATVDDRRTKFEQRDMQVTNQFGVQQIRVLKPYQVCVPSALGIVPDAPAPSALGIDHFRCYKARPKRGALKVDGIVVKLEDQFETRVARVRPALRYCNPVDKNGEGVADPSAHLTCYKLERLPADPEPPFVPKPVSIVNQFGDLALTARPLPHLCVPSLAIPDPGCVLDGQDLVLPDQPTANDCLDALQAAVPTGCCSGSVSSPFYGAPGNAQACFATCGLPPV